MGDSLQQAEQAALAIQEAFIDFLARFRGITRLARTRFEHRDWAGAHQDATDRLSLYRSAVAPLSAQVEEILGEHAEDKVVWGEMKVIFSRFIADRDDFDIAETFFNSVTRRIFATVGVDPDIEFVDSDFQTPPTHPRRPVYRTYQRTDDTAFLIEEILHDQGFESPFEDLARDARAVADRIEKHLLEVGALRIVELAEVVDVPFFRGKGAYVVARLFSGSQELPLVIALLHSEKGIRADAVLLHSHEVSVLFSFTRSYFHVDSERPYDLTRFLHSLMPRKKLAEIYISIGYNKHGKTEMYRDLLHHLETSAGKFVSARGKKGLVMVVFTMPGYDLVFKIIRDRFPPQKRVTRRQVMERYRHVFLHDRAGRLIDAQEFEHLAFDRDRFSDELIEELAAEAGETVRVNGNEVIVNHVYVERRVIPLDIYLREAADEAALRAVSDYGRCIKDLAVANIFPGDLLLKNFGLTRHGRVVFYDYDELADLLACNFRKIPEAMNPDDELSDEPWYTVGPDDVFPEELWRFLGLQGQQRQLFEAEHGDLFDTEFWHSTQQRLREADIIEVFPYSVEARI